MTIVLLSHHHGPSFSCSSIITEARHTIFGMKSDVSLTGLNADETTLAVCSPLFNPMYEK